MAFWNTLAKTLGVGAPQSLVGDMTSQMDLTKSEPSREARSIVEDPLSTLSQLGYKDKPYQLTYDTLKNMANRDSVIGAIILTRINQVITFSKPARYTKDGVGFEISLRDPKKSPTDEQNRFILALESFIENCGYEYDPSRDNFSTFLKKGVWDSLTYDQMCFEVVPDRLGRPAEIYAVDGSTIRASDATQYEADDTVGQYIQADTRKADDIQFVQVIENDVVAEFTARDLAFCTRNPRSDVTIQPYGYSELETLIHQITAHLYAEDYNTRYFSNGGTTKGILNLKGQNISKPQLDSFRRQWTAQLSGLTGAWKTPVVSVDGLEYINVSQSNREMEYESWMNYLINISCAVYQIDPAEVNFPNRGGASGGQGGSIMEGGMETRLKSSKDKGLRPLLRFIEDSINSKILRRFSDEYVFSFVGLDKETEAEHEELLAKLVKTRKTINEIRKLHDDPPIEGGNIILDPTYTNYILQLKQEQEMEQQEQAQAQAGAPMSPDAGGPNSTDDQGQPTDEEEQPVNSPSDDDQQQANQEQMISDGMDDRYNQ